MNKASVKDIPVSERPRERFIKYGKENLNIRELISIILNTGTKDKSVLELSDNIINSIENISDLKNMTLNRLSKIDGIGIVKATKLLCAIELGRRVYLENIKERIKLDTAEKVYNYIKNDFNDSQEYFYALYLDTKKNLIDKKLLFIGTLNKSIVHPREIFKNAYLTSASTIICVHNHPSGDSTPSKEDIILTKSLVEIGNLQGIKIIDHVIIGNDYYSFFENGNI